jgi:S-formylglutathione hydrolase FrmB
LEHDAQRSLAWFESGHSDAPFRTAAMHQLAALARRSGAHVVDLSPAGTHTFYFWQRCLQAALPSLVGATTRNPVQPLRLV